MSNQKDLKDFLYEGERLDDLQRDGMYIIQNPKWFCFGMDAVLLSAYAKVKEGRNVWTLAVATALFRYCFLDVLREAPLPGWNCKMILPKWQSAV